MRAFCLFAVLFVVGFAASGCNTGYVMGPEDELTEQEAPAESAQPTTSVAE